MKVGVLTGGGDCPGLNAVIRAVVRVVHNAGGQTLGLLEGWRGAIEGNYTALHPENTDDIIARGGTILGSSRTNPYKQPDDVDKLIASFYRLGFDAIVAIGGDDTLGVANKLHSEHNLPMIGCPKTIDNDLSSTDVTFGFDTSINIVMDAVDRLRTTAESHRRVMVIETMGRHAGWIACYSGVATAADYILVPEVEVDFDRMCDILVERRKNGKQYGIVIVSEGAKLPDAADFVTQAAEIDDFGHVRLGGLGQMVADIIEKRTEIETRCVTLGHLQRGGAPSAYDRVLGTRLGLHAGRLAINKDFGKMVALLGTKIVSVPLAEAVGTLRTLDEEFLDEAAEFFK
ncbi:MAG: ATP-dependent 6-phosphofructokinase [Planctomycetaceae bacterium]|jgi:ATP-dependent phosphofructokinase / diphosphate-dependent phosphofructokinase|nr:ATP-dependent 6-phosphofructokinase [Planctomycetaceae bacterium]MBT6484470.1 ATP-dependent 6-phosphofructokinase [Planctomycetaceae bacterium]MBT6495614.1 ATP-dependent 6-phosphofructokinase [Planctomycetaceae bacterium]